MKAITAWSALAFAAYVSADTCYDLASSVPSCATSCINSAASAVGCTQGDYGCQCSSSQSSAVQSLAQNCVISGCGGVASALSASASADAVCKCISSEGPGTGSTSATTSAAGSPSSSAGPTIPAPTSSGSSSEKGTVTSASSTGPITTAPQPPASSGGSCTASSPCEASAEAIPACGQSCLLSAGSANGCDATDYKCQCDKASVIQQGAQSCVISSCGANTALNVLTSASALCSCVTASPVTPCSGGATTSPSPSSSSSSASCSSAGGSSASGASSGANGSKPTTAAGSGGNGSAPSSGGSSPGSGTTCVAVPGPASSGSSTPDCSAKVAEIPSCAVSCLSTSIPQIGCSVTDYACQCTSSNKAALTSAVTPCVIQSCQGSDITKVQSATDAVCACANAAPAAPSSGGASTSCYPIGSQPSLSTNAVGAPTTNGGTSPTNTGSGTGPLQVTGAANRFSAGAGVVGAAFIAAIAL